MYWAEEEWPGFWAFSTLETMSIEELFDLSNAIHGSDKFDKFIQTLAAVGKNDKTEEGRDLLIKGSKSFLILQERLDEYQSDARKN